MTVTAPYTPYPFDATRLESVLRWPLRALANQPAKPVNVACSGTHGNSEDIPLKGSSCLPEDLCSPCSGISWAESNVWLSANWTDGMRVADSRSWWIRPCKCQFWSFNQQHWSFYTQTRLDMHWHWLDFDFTGNMITWPINLKINRVKFLQVNKYCYKSLELLFLQPVQTKIIDLGTTAYSYVLHQNPDC